MSHRPNKAIVTLVDIKDIGFWTSSKDGNIVLHFHQLPISQTWSPSAQRNLDILKNMLSLIHMEQTVHGPIELAIE
jgi:hypothetical protein